MDRTLVIAEAGSCHDGDLDRALALVDAAADAGADACKFQFWSDPDALADRRRALPSHREAYRRYRVPAFWLPVLHTRCGRRGIDFMATAYLPEDVATVAPLVARFKIASFEADARDLIEAHAPYAGERRLVVSLGMGAHGAVPPGWAAGAVDWLLCVSAYPAPADALNLARLRAGVYAGLSDHTDPSLTWTGALAVAAGARILEAHLRLVDTDPRNPDAPHAMTPPQLYEYARHVRFAERCAGDPDEAGAHESEREMAAYKVRGS